MNSITYLRQHIVELIGQEFKLLPKQIAGIYLNLDLTGKHGDLSTNAALIIAGMIHKAPLVVAEQIATLLTSPLLDGHPNPLVAHIKSVDVISPGFVNITLTENTWHTTAHELVVHPHSCFTLDAEETHSSYLVEFVSANPTGPLSLAHGRNAIIGDVLCRVLKFLGHKVWREFYINDAGMQIKHLGTSLQVAVQKKLGQTPTVSEVQYENSYMDELAEHCLEEYGQAVVQQSPEFWSNYAKAYFLRKIEQDLQRYGVEFDAWFSEKILFDTNKVQEALQLLHDKGYLYQQDDALWFKSQAFGDDKDRVIRKADGELTYIASDIAYHKNKFEREFDYLINIFGQDHHGYAKRLSATMQALGFPAEKLHILLYQLVRVVHGEELVKMSKRSGTFRSLDEVIDLVGRDVARFFYLNRKADAHLDFDLDVALRKDNDNPVYYIHYAYVRTGSILTKALETDALREYVEKLSQHNLNEVFTQSLEQDLNLNEIALLKRVCHLKDVLTNIARTQQTHLLANYAFELAQAFHAYYNTHKVIDLSDLLFTRSRLMLMSIMRDTLGLTLDLLGLSRPDRM